MGELARAYELSRRVHAAHGRSFYRATSVLPPGRRKHVWALYAVARRADDIVDRPQPHTDPASGLREWERLVLGAVRSREAPSDPLLLALSATCGEFDLPAAPFQRFFASMRRDLTQREYATWTELRDYMRGSAAAIGELTAPILGAGPGGLPYARRLGEAFQLTNFIRDVAEDWQRGRVYLPISDLRACGVSTGELGDAVATGSSGPGVRRLVRLECDRARELYDAALPGLDEVDAVVRPCLRVAITLYAAILTGVERSGWEVCRERTTVGPARRALAVTGALTGVAPARSAGSRPRA